MNILIMLPLIVFVAAFGILVTRSHGVVLGRQLPVQPVLGVLVGVLAGGSVVALNYDVVPDSVEIALSMVLFMVAAGSAALVALDLMG